jgi:hypothetical protein
MGDILIKALYNRIEAGQMAIEQVPEIYREQVQIIIDEQSNNS